MGRYGRKIVREYRWGIAIYISFYFWTSQTYLIFVVSAVSVVRFPNPLPKVRRGPCLVRPGLVAELQLRTVPFSNCLAKILRIVDVAGSLIPGNLTLKRWRRSGKKFLPPLLLMIFHHKEVPVLEVKLWCHQSTYKKLCKEFRLIRSTTGYLCLVFKILRRNRSSGVFYSVLDWS